MSGGERGGQYSSGISAQGEAARQLRSEAVSQADWPVVTESSDNSEDGVHRCSLDRQGAALIQ